MKKLKLKKKLSGFLGLFLTLALLLSFFPLVSLGQEEASQDQDQPESIMEGDLVYEDVPEETLPIDEDDTEMGDELLAEEPEPELLDQESSEEVEVVDEIEAEEEEIKLTYKGLILTGQDLELEKLKPSLEEIGAYMNTLKDWDYKSMSFFALKGEGYFDFSKKGQDRQDVYILEDEKARLLLDSRLTRGNYLLAQDLIEVDEEILLRPGEDLELALEEGCWRLEGDQILDYADEGFKALEKGQARLVYFSLEDGLLAFKALDLMVEEVAGEVEEEVPEEEAGEEENLEEEPEEKPKDLEEDSLENKPETAPPIEKTEEGKIEGETEEEIEPEAEPPKDNQAGDDDLSESLPDEDAKEAEEDGELLMAELEAMPLCHNPKLTVITYIAGNYGSLARIFDYKLQVGKADSYNFSLGHGDFRDFSFKSGERTILEVINPQPYQVTVKVNGRVLKGDGGVYILEGLCKDTLIEIANSYYVDLDMGLSQEEDLLILSLGLIFLVIAFIGWRRWVYWIKD